MTKKTASKKNALVVVAAADESIIDQAVIDAIQSSEDQATELTATDLDMLDAKLDALDAQIDLTNVTVDVTAGSTDIDPSKDFAELLAALPEDAKLDKAKAIGASFDDRIEWLKTNKPNNTTQAPKLDSYRKKLALPSKAAVLLVTGTSEEFINRSISAGSTYNIYAIDKVIDLVNSLTGDTKMNAINKAVLKSMLNFKNEGISFTGEMAKAAASDKIRISDKKAAGLLARHTVDAGTAPTQSSSTMSALQTLGIVVNRGSMKAPVYELTDTPATRKLAEVLAA